MLETSTVFRAGDGCQRFRIPGICVTLCGTVLIWAEARNTRSDWGEIDIVMRRSMDGARTFDAPRTIALWHGEVERDPTLLQHAQSRAKGRTHNNPVLIAANNGRIHFLFCIEYRRVFHRVSEDDGWSWSEPQEITSAFEPLRAQYPWKVIATGPNHGIQLSSGRLLVPVWAASSKISDHRPSVVSSVYSDDDGATWHCGDIVAHESGDSEARTDKAAINPSETVAVEMKNGRVLFNIRNESPTHRRLIATSPNGATNWTKPQFHSELFEPICAAGLVRTAKGLLFSNPNPPVDGPQVKPADYRQRRNLVLKLSRDDGLSWPVQRVLDAGAAGYSDLAVLSDETMLCFYERGTETLTLARFDANWLMAGARISFNG